MRLLLIIAPSIVLTGCAAYWSDSSDSQVDLDDQAPHRVTAKAEPYNGYALRLDSCSDKDGWSALLIECPEDEDVSFDVSIAVGYFIGGMTLPEPQWCGEQPDGIEVICEWDTPAALRFRTSKLLFGPPIPDQLDTVRLSGNVINETKFGYNYHYLILLVRHGEEFNMRKFEPLGWTDRDTPDEMYELAVPIYRPLDYISWLPCSVSQNPEDVDFWGPSEVTELVWVLLEDDERQEMRDFVEVEGDWATVKNGIYLDEIERRLTGLTKAEIKNGCDPL